MPGGISACEKNAHFAHGAIRATRVNIELGGEGGYATLAPRFAGWAFISQTPVTQKTEQAAQRSINLFKGAWPAHVNFVAATSNTFRQRENTIRSYDVPASLLHVQDAPLRSPILIIVEVAGVVQHCQGSQVPGHGASRS